jgi:hypothetical protein
MDKSNLGGVRNDEFGYVKGRGEHQQYLVRTVRTTRIIHPRPIHWIQSKDVDLIKLHETMNKDLSTNGSYNNKNYFPSSVGVACRVLLAACCLPKMTALYKTQHYKPPPTCAITSSFRDCRQKYEIMTTLLQLNSHSG